MHKLYVVGLGPGGADGMTVRAKNVLQASDVIVGYTVYIDLVRADFPDKEFLSTPMRKEVDRVRLALETAAQGRTVALICSGDAGVYGMSGLCEELLPQYPGVELETVPGVSAVLSGAAILGAPLMHDFAVISLSVSIIRRAISGTTICSAPAISSSGSPRPKPSAALQGTSAERASQRRF